MNFGPRRTLQRREGSCDDLEVALARLVTSHRQGPLTSDAMDHQNCADNCQVFRHDQRIWRHEKGETGIYTLGSRGMLASGAGVSGVRRDDGDDDSDGDPHYHFCLTKAKMERAQRGSIFHNRRQDPLDSNSVLNLVVGTRSQPTQPTAQTSAESQTNAKGRPVRFSLELRVGRKTVEHLLTAHLIEI